MCLSLWLKESRIIPGGYFSRGHLSLSLVLFSLCIFQMWGVNPKLKEKSLWP